MFPFESRTQMLHIQGACFQCLGSDLYVMNPKSTLCSVTHQKGLQEARARSRIRTPRVAELFEVACLVGRNLQSLQESIQSLLGDVLFLEFPVNPMYTWPLSVKLSASYSSHCLLSHKILMQTLENNLAAGVAPEIQKSRLVLH